LNLKIFIFFKVYNFVIGILLIFCLNDGTGINCLLEQHADGPHISWRSDKLHILHQNLGRTDVQTALNLEVILVFTVDAALQVCQFEGVIVESDDVFEFQVHMHDLVSMHAPEAPADLG